LYRLNNAAAWHNSLYYIIESNPVEVNKIFILTDIPCPNQQANQEKSRTGKYIYKTLSDTLNPAYSDTFIYNQYPEKVKNSAGYYFQQKHSVPIFP